MDAVIVLGIVLATIVMFATERVPMEVASLTIVLMLAVSGVLTAQEAVAGFSNGTVIFIFTLLAMTRGLAATGVMDLAGRRAAFLGRLGQRAYLAVLLTVVAAFSSIASNTAVTAAFIPVASATAARARVPLSRVLMPLAFSSMLGGTVFLFGTSTNLIVSEAMVGMGMQPLGFAEQAVVGLPLTALALVWIVATSHRLPVRHGAVGDPPLAHRQYVTEAVLTPRSRLIGWRLSELRDTLGLSILGLLRSGRWIPARHDERVQVQDRLVLSGNRAGILRIKDLRSMVLHSELELRGLRERSGAAGDEVLVEAFVSQHSPMVGRQVGDLHFRRNLDVVPLAIDRHPGFEGGGRPHVLRPVVEGSSLRGTRLSAGDVLLLGGTTSAIRQLAEGQALTILGEVEYSRPRYRRAVLATAIFAAAVAAAGAGVVAPSLAGIAGMLAMIATGCVDARNAFRVEWRVVLLVGSLLALGQAMEKSGAGGLVAGALLPVAEAGGPRAVLLAVMLLTVLLSAPMSNQAAALVVLPVAVHVAQSLGLEARPFAIGTCLAASCSFVTPLEPSAALVYGPGHYRFHDFVRAGAPLTAMILLALTMAVPVFWPFR